MYIITFQYKITHAYQIMGYSNQFLDFGITFAWLSINQLEAKSTKNRAFFMYICNFLKKEL